MLGIGEEPDFVDRHICDALEVRRDDSILHHPGVHLGEIQNGGDEGNESATAVCHDAQGRALFLRQGTGNFIQQQMGTFLDRGHGRA